MACTNGFEIEPDEVQKKNWSEHSRQGENKQKAKKTTKTPIEPRKLEASQTRRNKPETIALQSVRGE